MSAEQTIMALGANLGRAGRENDRLRARVEALEALAGDMADTLSRLGSLGVLKGEWANIAGMEVERAMALLGATAEGRAR